MQSRPATTKLEMMRFMIELLSYGVTATRWQFGEAQTRDRHGAHREFRIAPCVSKQIRDSILHLPASTHADAEAHREQRTAVALPGPHDYSMKSPCKLL